MIKAILEKGKILLDHKSYQSLSAKGYGLKTNQIYELEPQEALYLIEKNKIEVFLQTNQSKALTFQELLRKTKLQLTDYIVYQDLKKKGYNVKTALKYGFKFRVYDKGIKEGQDHALWFIEPVSEQDKLKIHEFQAKNRVANTARKKMMLALVDTENSVTYLEITWKRL